MAKISPKGDAARALLAGLPEFGAGDKSVGALSDAYAQRLANAAQRQLAAGVTPSRQAARGHVLTPEHPRSAPPKLPEQPSTYQRVRQTLRDTSLQPETPSRPSQGRTEALTGERSPRLHVRERGESHIPFAETGAIYTRNAPRDARGVIEEAAAHDDRLVMQVYDCSRRRWAPVFRHGRTTGISADYLLSEIADHGGGFARFFLDTVNDASYNDRGRLAHICQYEITILPKPTAAVKALQQSLKPRR